MKAEILALLRERADYVSGQELCGHFGVSRTAVWKAINQLKKEGYRIKAVQNKGYHLLPEEAVFGKNEIESRLQTKWAGRNLSFYESINSTNIRAKLEAEDGAPEGTLVVADMQTAGRGRRGRGWESPAGRNVYFTLVVKPSFAPDRASMLTLVMALAVNRAIRKVTGISSAIKWPNDLVAEGRKVCGMLTEMSVERDYIHYIVIGVGINVAKQEFPEEIAGTAAALEEFTGSPINRAELVAEVMSAFEEYYETFCRTADLSGLTQEYNESLVNSGRTVRVLDPKGEFCGTAKGINELGELLVEREDGTTEAIYAGEVSVRGVYGYV